MGETKDEESQGGIVANKIGECVCVLVTISIMEGRRKRGEGGSFEVSVWKIET